MTRRERSIAMGAQTAIMLSGYTQRTMTKFVCRVVLDIEAISNESTGVSAEVVVFGLFNAFGDPPNPPEWMSDELFHAIRYGAQEAKA